jgi:hypothetical protein
MLAEMSANVPCTVRVHNNSTNKKTQTNAEASCGEEAIETLIN